MKYKILVADDSLTIQKVIKITLANEPYEIFECLNDQDLYSSVQSVKPHIVLLDFNFSESKSGYDIVKEIHKYNDDIKVIILFGTFDNFTDQEVSGCGAHNKIVKPFDGTKFINICRSVTSDIEIEPDVEEVSNHFPEQIQEQEISFDEETLNEDFPQEMSVDRDEEISSRNLFDDEEEDQWVVGGPDFEEVEAQQMDAEEEVKAASSILDQQVKDWGMDVPGIIDGDNNSSDIVEMPAVINIFSESDDIVIPSDKDLEYPDMGKHSTGQLVSVDELNDVEIQDFTDVINDGGTSTEEGVRNIEAQIADEIEEDADLWNVDVISDSPTMIVQEEVETDLPPVSSHNLHEVIEEDDPEIAETENWDVSIADRVDHSNKNEEMIKSAFSSAMSKRTASISSEIDYDKLAIKLMDNMNFKASIIEGMKKGVEEAIRKQCAEHVDKIAWEVIPDLAENVIKSELKRISDSVM